MTDQTVVLRRGSRSSSRGEHTFKGRGQVGLLGFVLLCCLLVVCWLCTPVLLHSLLLLCLVPSVLGAGVINLLSFHKHPGMPWALVGLLSLILSAPVAGPLWAAASSWPAGGVAAAPQPASSSSTSAAAAPLVLFDHDGGVDDFITLLLLLARPDKACIIGEDTAHAGPHTKPAGTQQQPTHSPHPPGPATWLEKPTHTQPAAHAHSPHPPSQPSHFSTCRTPQTTCRDHHP